MNPQSIPGQPPGAAKQPPPGTPGAPPKTTAPPNANNTQNSLQIAEIRDGVAILNDGTFRTVVMCKSINFDLMSPQEREAVEFAYQGFLNSLYFPIQIFIRSEKVDLRPYLEKLDRLGTQQDNMLLGMLIQDYVQFLAGIAEQTNIMDKQFYVVIGYPDDPEDIRSAFNQSTSFFKNAAGLFKKKDKAKPVVVDQTVLEGARTELRNRVEAVMSGLRQCGVQSLPLDTQEMIELFYNVYNPDTATHEHLININDLTTPYIQKGAGNAPQPQLDRQGA